MKLLSKIGQNLLRQQLQIDLAEARNDLLPEIQAVVAGSQDVGAPATSKNDKSQYELEAGLFLEVPVQRRKARGKMTAVEGKLGQLAAKQRMTTDKITTDVQAVYAALVAAYQQIERAHESAELADRLADIERRKFELGESDLLSVNLREQQTGWQLVSRRDWRLHRPEPPLGLLGRALDLCVPPHRSVADHCLHWRS